MPLSIQSLLLPRSRVTIAFTIVGSHRVVRFAGSQLCRNLKECRTREVRLAQNELASPLAWSRVGVLAGGGVPLDASPTHGDVGELGANSESFSQIDPWNSCYCRMEEIEIRCARP